MCLLIPLCFFICRLNLFKASHSSILPPPKSSKVPLSFSSSSMKLVGGSSSSSTQIKRWVFVCTPAVESGGFMLTSAYFCVDVKRISYGILKVKCMYENKGILKQVSLFLSLSVSPSSPFSLSVFSTRPAVIHWHRSSAVFWVSWSPKPRTRSSGKWHQRRHNDIRGLLHTSIHISSIFDQWWFSSVSFYRFCFSICTIGLMWQCSNNRQITSVKEKQIHTTLNWNNTYC